VCPGVGGREDLLPAPARQELAELRRLGQEPPARADGERAVEARREVRAALQEAREGAARDREQERALHGDHRGRGRASLEERHLPQDLAGPELAEPDPARVARHGRDQPLEHHVERGRVLPLLDHPRLGDHRPLVRDREERVGVGRRELAEEVEGGLHRERPPGRGRAAS
jgi:hypothetical protein